MFHNRSAAPLTADNKDQLLRDGHVYPERVLRHYAGKFGFIIGHDCVRQAETGENTLTS